MIYITLLNQKENIMFFKTLYNLLICGANNKDYKTLEEEYEKES